MTSHSSVASFSGTSVEKPSAPRSRKLPCLAHLAHSPKNPPCGLAALCWIGQATINLSANILSALLGLLSVFIFTRLFLPHDYGVYLLGVGLAAVDQHLPRGLVPKSSSDERACAKRTAPTFSGLVSIGLPGSAVSTRPLPMGLGRLVGTGRDGNGRRDRTCGRDRPVRTHTGSGLRAAYGRHRQ